MAAPGAGHRMRIDRALRPLAAPAKRARAGETLIRRNPLVYPQARRLLAKLERQSLDERREWTRARLERALAWAARTAYGQAAGAGTALERWPLLEPATVRERPRDFMLAAGWNIVSSTGGTTGIPLPLARSPRSVAFEQAALDHLLAAQGLAPARARVAVLRGDDIKAPDDSTPPFSVSTLGGRRRTFSSNHLNRGTVKEFARELRECNADYWWVYPTTLEALLRLVREAGETLSVPLIFSSSEVLSPWCREAARATFGARLLDYYGQAERVAFAWSAGDGRYFFLPGYAHVELIPREEGEGGLYEIVGTPLWNQAMPLPRYRTGDLIRTERPLEPHEVEQISLGMRPFAGVIGRDGDILIAPDGTRLTGIDHFHRGVEHIVRIQVAQPIAERVEIRVIPTPEFGDRDREALIANARRKLPVSMCVEVKLVEELERTALGKTPFVIRRAHSAERPA
jgi:phenylacetate-CoA ligase